MPLVDANIVLRYVLNDHPQLSQQAADMLEQQTVIVPVEVVCEVVYVLQKVYHISREEIHRKLSDLLAESLITVEKPAIVQHALQTYSTSSLDIVDAFLSAYHVVEQQQVLTFDEKLQKYLLHSQEQRTPHDK
jgi:predicted nucleic-acid-binding protein